MFRFMKIIWKFIFCSFSEINFFFVKYYEYFRFLFIFMNDNDLEVEILIWVGGGFFGEKI